MESMKDVKEWFLHKCRIFQNGLGLDLHDVILLLCELDRQDISSSKIPSSELALLDVSPEPGITKSGIVLGVSPPRKSAHF
jgi:hypothetical protein